MGIIRHTFLFMTANIMYCGLHISQLYCMTLFP